MYAHALADQGYRRFGFGNNALLNVWQAESNSPYVVSQATGVFATAPDLWPPVHLNRRQRTRPQLFGCRNRPTVLYC